MRMTENDPIDRALVEATQRGLPLTPRPYGAIAEQLEISESEVRNRLTAMLASGEIRRIGAVPNHYALGYKANGMTVWDVADDQVDRLGAEVGALEFVSHCYRRPRHEPIWSYNLFAMAHGKSREEVEEKAKIIADLLGPACRGSEILYSTRILKKTGLRIGRAKE